MKNIKLLNTLKFWGSDTPRPPILAYKRGSLKLCSLNYFLIEVGTRKYRALWRDQECPRVRILLEIFKALCLAQN